MSSNSGSLLQRAAPPMLQRQAQAATRSPLAVVSLAFYALNRAYAMWSLGVNTVLYGALYIFARGVPPTTHTRPRKGYAPAVFVTGAHDGIGRATAFLLAESGWTVFAGVRRSEDMQNLRLAFDSYADELSTPPKGTLRVVACDVLDRDNIAFVVSDITTTLAADQNRPFVGLVNVAGFCMISPMELTARADIERMFNLDLLAYVDVVRAFFPLLRAHRGRVVNVGSVSGYAAVPGWGAYSGAKAGIENLTRAWGLEVAPLGIRMATVRPGIVASAAIGPKIQTSIDGWRADEKAIGYDSVGRTLYPESGMDAAHVAPYKTMLEENARNLERAMDGGTPAVNVAKTIRDALMERWMQPVYTVGPDALLGQMLRDFVPEPVYEWMALKGMT